MLFGYCSIDGKFAVAGIGGYNDVACGVEIPLAYSFNSKGVTDSVSKNAATRGKRNVLDLIVGRIISLLLHITNAAVWQQAANG